MLLKQVWLKWGFVLVRESCLNYIIFWVALIHQTEESQKNKESPAFTMITCLPNTAPSNTSASLSPTHSQSLSDLLSRSHPLLPHTSHLSLLHSERPIWRSESAIGAVAHQCLTNPLSIFQHHSSGWKSDKSDKLNREARVLDVSLTKLEDFISTECCLGWINISAPTTVFIRSTHQWKNSRVHMSHVCDTLYVKKCVNVH